MIVKKIKAKRDSSGDLYWWVYMVKVGEWRRLMITGLKNKKEAIEFLKGFQQLWETLSK